MSRQPDSTVHNVELALLLRRRGWGVIPPEQYHIDIEESFRSDWQQCAPYTMTSLERGYGLWKAVEYLCENSIRGALVECGVWRGGSCMLMAHALQRFEGTERQVYLYDTFTGMTEPGEHDRIAWNGQSMRERETFPSWAVGIEEVKQNLAQTDYPGENLHFIKGDVGETLEQVVPNRIALLRLDTDWYESTRVELEILFPKLVPGGVLIVDDYGHFTGAQKAVDEYFASADSPLLFNRLDYTGRIGVKIW
jgi:hypothetical protein